MHAQYWRIWTPHGLRKIKHRLVIDIANPSAVDTYFPPLRSFDFFHGHSTVDGLLESPHGRAWTSASEDLHTAHAIKLWGYVNGNKNLQFMGSLMSAVIIRTAKRYTFMGRDNGIMPHDFKMNMVAGILFENKADHRRFKPIRPGLLSTVMTSMAQIRPISQLTPYLRDPRIVQESLIRSFGITFTDSTVRDVVGYTFPTSLPGVPNSATNIIWILLMSVGWMIL